MNKKNFASFVAGLAVMGVVWAGVSGVQYYQRQSSGRLGERYGAIEEKLDKIDKIIDIGTGAGFPGMPLKIAFPHLKVTLLDSLNKRIKFLDAVIDELKLEEIETIHGRAEDYARQEQYRENYDLCVSRAVSNLSTLSEYCLPYVKKEGVFISYKSGDIEEELLKSKKAIQILGGRVEDVVKFSLPETDIHRSFVKIRKTSATKNKYPRKAGLPAKEPLS